MTIIEIVITTSEFVCVCAYVCVCVVWWGLGSGVPAVTWALIDGWLMHDDGCTLTLSR